MTRKQSLKHSPATPVSQYDNDTYQCGGAFALVMKYRLSQGVNNERGELSRRDSLARLGVDWSAKRNFRSICLPWTWPPLDKAGVGSVALGNREVGFLSLPTPPPSPFGNYAPIAVPLGSN